MRGVARHRRRLAGTVLAAGLALAGCGGSSSSSGAGATAVPGAGATVAGPNAAAPAVLQFKAPLLGGGAFDGTTYTGKPVAFWFWAPW